MTSKNIYNIGLINPTDWDRAKWQATGFFVDENNDNLPCFGFIFHNKKGAEKIFKQWHQQIGAEDVFEEIRISIIEGFEGYDDMGYIIHLSSDPFQTLERLKSQGHPLKINKVAARSMFQPMNPVPNSPHLPNFRRGYKKRKEFAIVPLWRSSKFHSDLKIFSKLTIIKKQIYFRRLKDIKEGDPDWPVFSSGLL
jgi:hypothetical protein